MCRHPESPADLPDDEPSDEALAASFHAGDKAAGDQLVARYRFSLLGYLRRLTLSGELAEDIAQQTWLSVVENLGSFDPKVGPGFRAWLFRIATNKATDAWRRRVRGHHVMEEFSRGATESAEPTAGLEQRETHARLTWAISQLPEAQRQVLMLRYYSDMKFVEIAEVLGCPLNTALGRMHKAVLALRDLMTAEVHHE